MMRLIFLQSMEFSMVARNQTSTRKPRQRICTRRPPGKRTPSQTADRAFATRHGLHKSFPRCKQICSPDKNIPTFKALALRIYQYSAQTSGCCGPVNGDKFPVATLRILPSANNLILPPFTGKRMQWPSNRVEKRQAWPCGAFLHQRFSSQGGHHGKINA